MAKTKERLSTALNVPLTPSMKKEIRTLAEREERKPAEMGRMLWREALDAREEAAAALTPAGAK
jgi:hypothetical protein